MKTTSHLRTAGLVLGSLISTSLMADALYTRGAVKEKIAASVEQDNIVWSATSLDGLLSLVGLGYDDEAQALLENFLGKPVSEAADASSLLKREAEGIKVETANNMWAAPDFNLREDYLAELSTRFDGLTPGVLDVQDPYGSAALINKWASDNTNGLIDNVVNPDMIKPQTASILANALYFKGTWLEEFDPELTEDLPFNTTARLGEDVVVEDVPMMQKNRGDVEFAISSEDSVATIRLPYMGNEYAMYISFAAVTNESAGGTVIKTEVAPLAAVEDVYKKYIIEGKAFDAELRKVNFDTFGMPKFEVATTLKEIIPTLVGSGYGRLFQEGALSRMSDDARAMLSVIFQKAKIIVNEEGSEAAAVTGGGIDLSTSVPVMSFLEVNGPFSFAIRDDKNGVTLFEGMVRNPSIK